MEDRPFGAPKLAQFPAAQKQMLHPPEPVSDDPHERAKPVLDQIALDLLWLPWAEMTEFCKELLGGDNKAPASPHEMAKRVVNWCKGREKT